MVSEQFINAALKGLQKALKAMILWVAQGPTGHVEIRRWYFVSDLKYDPQVPAPVTFDRFTVNQHIHNNDARSRNKS